MTKEQKERYLYQQTEAGKDTMEMLDYLKEQYCEKLGIPSSKIRTGKLTALVNANTGMIDRFIEE